MVHAVYVSDLPAGFKLRDESTPLCNQVGKNKVVDGVVHTVDACFLICEDAQTGESIVQWSQGKPVYQGAGQVSRLTACVDAVEARTIWCIWGIR